MLDPIDKKIIDTLQKQGRITNVDLARMNDLAPSSMLERVRRLEERGIITGYRAELNPKLLGYQVQAMVAINLDRHQAGPIDVFESKINSIPEVMACYHVTGRYDYMVDVAVRDIDALVLAVPHRDYFSGKLEPGATVRRAQRPIAVVDCFGILNDTDIESFMELGCEVRCMGRGHVERLRRPINK